MRRAAKDTIDKKIKKEIPSFGSIVQHEVKAKQAGPTEAQRDQLVKQAVKIDYEKAKTPGSKAALEFILQKVLADEEAMKDAANKEWWRRFNEWLQGRGTKEEVARTQWGAANAARIDDSVREYLMTHIHRRHRFAMSIAELFYRYPKNLVEFYLYYKYIVHGGVRLVTDAKGNKYYDMSNEDFLKDYDLLQSGPDSAPQEEKIDEKREEGGFFSVPRPPRKTQEQRDAEGTNVLVEKLESVSDSLPEEKAKKKQKPEEKMPNILKATDSTSDDSKGDDTGDATADVGPKDSPPPPPSSVPPVLSKDAEEVERLMRKRRKRGAEFDPHDSHDRELADALETLGQKSESSEDRKKMREVKQTLHDRNASKVIRELDRQDPEAGEAVAENKELKKQVKEHVESIRVRNERLAALNTKNDKLRTERQGLLTEIDALKQEAAAAEGENALKLSAEVAKKEKALQKLQAQMAENEEQKRVADERITMLAQRLEEERGKSAAAQGVAKEIFENATTQLTAQEKQLEKVTSEREQARAEVERERAARQEMEARAKSIIDELAKAQTPDQIVKVEERIVNLEPRERARYEQFIQQQRQQLQGAQEELQRLRAQHSEKAEEEAFDEEAARKRLFAEANKQYQERAAAFMTKVNEELGKRDEQVKGKLEEQKQKEEELRGHLAKVRQHRFEEQDKTKAEIAARDAEIERLQHQLDQAELDRRMSEAERAKMHKQELAAVRRDNEEKIKALQQGQRNQVMALEAAGASEKELRATIQKQQGELDAAEQRWNLQGKDMQVMADSLRRAEEALRKKEQTEQRMLKKLAEAEKKAKELEAGESKKMREVRKKEQEVRSKTGKLARREKEVEAKEAGLEKKRKEVKQAVDRSRQIGILPSTQQQLDKAEKRSGRVPLSTLLTLNEPGRPSNRARRRATEQTRQQYAKEASKADTYAKKASFKAAFRAPDKKNRAKFQAELKTKLPTETDNEELIDAMREALKEKLKKDRQAKRKKKTKTTVQDLAVHVREGGKASAQQVKKALTAELGRAPLPTEMKEVREEFKETVGRKKAKV